MSKLKWTIVSTAEVVSEIKIQPHKWKHTKTFHWEYCGQCGIIAVNNWPTIKLCRKLCGSFWN